MTRNSRAPTLPAKCGLPNARSYRDPRVVIKARIPQGQESSCLSLERFSAFRSPSGEPQRDFPSRQPSIPRERQILISIFLNLRCKVVRQQRY
jgi:hypothetical protein